MGGQQDADSHVISRQNIEPQLLLHPAQGKWVDCMRAMFNYYNIRLPKSGGSPHHRKFHRFQVDHQRFQPLQETRLLVPTHKPQTTHNPQYLYTLKENEGKNSRATDPASFESIIFRRTFSEVDGNGSLLRRFWKQKNWQVDHGWALSLHWGPPALRKGMETSTAACWYSLQHLGSQPRPKIFR